MPVQITEKTMEHLERLSKLKLTDGESVVIQKEMQKMLDYAELLQGIQTEEADMFSSKGVLYNVLREDVTEEPNDPAELLLNAPAVKDGQFKVPRTVGQERGSL